MPIEAQPHTSSCAATRLQQRIAELLKNLQAMGYTGRLSINVDFNRGGITGATVSESRRLDLK